MEKIEWNDIDWVFLKRMKNNGTKSRMYIDGNTCIKILCDLSEEEEKIMYRKLLEMEGLSIQGVLLPKSLIVENDHLKGYTLDYWKDAINFFDYFTSTRYLECQDFLTAVKKTSLILREIHKEKILCQDLSFDNILIDQNGNVKYCDIDGCSYKGISSPYVSLLLKRFLIDFRKNESVVLSENTDRLSLLLSFFYLIYFKEIQKVSKRKYQSLSKQLTTLENMRTCATTLVNKRKPIPEIPYIDEWIEESDHYVIDREKQKSVKQKVLGQLKKV